MRILIIKLGAMGDVLRTTILLPALKEKYNDVEIDWVTKKNSVDLIRNNPHIKEIFAIEDVDSLEAEYDLLINFDDDEDACKLASKIKTKKLIGAYEEGGERKYTDDSSIWFDMGLISKFGKEKADELKAQNERTYPDIHFEILGLGDAVEYPPQLVLDGENFLFGKEFKEKNGISDDDIVIGVNTGAGGRWQDKKLSVDQTAEIIAALQENPKVKILLFGGPEEVERNNEILGKTENVIDAGCKNSLLDFSALVNLCNILLTSDSLAMHIGIALEKYVVAFFYPTSAAEIELYGKGTKIVAKGNSYCSYQPKCDDPPTWDLTEIIEAVKSHM